uniref:DUF834 domain-containing protein n=1 Tax=Oryza meridionalis TaxID=40149 RepID=A0A0E0ESH5_9ORYZ
MNSTRQNTWVKEDLLAMDLSLYVDGGGGSGVKKVKEAATGEGARTCEGGSGQSPGVPDPVVPNHLETGSGAHHLEATTGDHHRSSVARGWPTAGGEASVALAAERRGEARAEAEARLEAPPVEAAERQKSSQTGWDLKPFEVSKPHL